MMYTVIALSIAVIGLCFKNQRFENSVDMKDRMLQAQQKDFQFMTNELKDIMSLNKMCIEKWEKSALDNTNLNSTNLQLVSYINELENKTKSI